jgi:acetylornithine deacetylase
MDAITLTRQLVDIESISGNEAAVGNYLYGELCRVGYQTCGIPVQNDRFNVYATSPEQPHPTVVFSTHMDTVPPFIPSSEDATRIYGRGSCDAKGIIAAQIAASERLRGKGFTLDCCSWWEKSATAWARKWPMNTPRIAGDPQAQRSKYLVNGEPTENRIALASKGTLRVEVTASGRMAHSAYPELGESAIDKLIEALARLRAMPLPSDPEIGPCTLNIGLIEGGRAPNVIPDYAHADLVYRLVGSSQDLRRQILETAGDQVKIEFPLEFPFLRLRTVDGLPTMIAAFTTDIPSAHELGRAAADRSGIDSRRAHRSIWRVHRVPQLRPFILVAEIAMAPSGPGTYTSSLILVFRSYVTYLSGAPISPTRSSSFSPSFFHFAR